MAYVQGGAYAAAGIMEDPDVIFEYSGKGNRLALISDGSAVLGMGTSAPGRLCR